MAKPISSLEADLKQLSLTIVGNCEKRQRNAALDIYIGLTRVNPKKTGRSAGSWQIGIGAPVRLVSQPPVGSEKAPAAFVAARQREESSKLSRPISADITAIHITNIIEYIGPLNAGSSKQADPLWIQKEVRRVASSNKGARLLESK